MDSGRAVRHLPAGLVDEVAAAEVEDKGKKEEEEMGLGLG